MDIIFPIVFEAVSVPLRWLRTTTNITIDLQIFCQHSLVTKHAGLPVDVVADEHAEQELVGKLHWFVASIDKQQIQWDCQGWDLLDKPCSLHIDQKSEFTGCISPIRHINELQGQESTTTHKDDKP